MTFREGFLAEHFEGIGVSATETCGASRSSNLPRDARYERTIACKNNSLKTKISGARVFDLSLVNRGVNTPAPANSNVSQLFDRRPI